MRTKRFEPKTLAVLLSGLSLSLAIGTVHAARLGELVTVSAIGEPLRVEISAPGATAEQIASCLRVLPHSADADGIPLVTQARLSLAGSGQRARIVATHPAPALEPLLKLVLQEGCDARLTREYVLLLPAPSELSPPVVARAPTTARAASAPSPRPATTPSRGAGATQTWTTVAGESVTTIAQAMYPRDSGARNAFVSGVVRANPQLFSGSTSASTTLPPGTRLDIPSLGRVAAASSERPVVRRPPIAAGGASSEPPPQPASTPERPADRAPAPSTPSARPSAVAADVSADRLVVQQNVDTPESAAIQVAPADADEAAREEILVSAIDRTIDTQLELLERLRRLEEIQQALRTQLEQEDTQADAQSASAVPSVAAPVATDTIEERFPERPIEQSRDASSSGWREAAVGAAIALLLLLWLVRRRRQDEQYASTPVASRPDKIAPTAVSTRSAPTQPDVAPLQDRQRAAPDALPKRHEGLESQGRRPETPPLAFPTSGTVAPALDESTALPAFSPEDEIVEEHESAVELADIMVSFGRLHGAAETLAEFIRGNPKQALMPWLKLLDIYRSAGMKPEFDTLARQLNKTFNVKAVTWDNFEAARTDGVDVESMPHILAKIQNLWGTRDCQAFLETVVRDNRDGTRQGFGLGVIDDILVLSAVLEEQLGRFKPTIN